MFCFLDFETMFTTLEGDESSIAYCSVEGLFCGRRVLAM